MVQRLEARDVPSASPMGDGGAERAHALARHSVRPEADVEGLIPLTQLGPGETYEGLTGGLYGNGSNQIPPALLSAGLAAEANIQPLNGHGHPAAHGKIGVIALGQSTTQQWFAAFQGLARVDRSALNPALFFVNGGQGGDVSSTWVSSNQPWATLAKDVGSRRLQVQVGFLDADLINGQDYGSAQAEANVYSDELSRIVANAKRHYPNLHLVYLFPFHWAGTAGPGRAITEPAGYQLQFGIRQQILGQSLGSPVELWGPDIWPQTEIPAMYYDGIHFTLFGRVTMANLTMQFLQNEPTAGWFWR
jgi:hypothetical protein